MDAALLHVSGADPYDVRGQIVGNGLIKRSLKGRTKVSRSWRIRDSGPASLPLAQQEIAQGDQEWEQTITSKAPVKRKSAAPLMHEAAMGWSMRRARLWKLSVAGLRLFLSILWP